MVQLLEKTGFDKNGFTSRLWYDKELIQTRFKLPTREENFNSNIFSLIQESCLLSFYFIRDKRFRQIASIVFKLLKKVAKKDPNCPYYLKNAFFELGPTFVKIGQFLSSRRDIIPEEYIKVLSELQDSIPPIPFSEMKVQIEKELRKPLETVFKSFNEEPIASASIGQVYRAELTNSMQVAVKVQRPDLNVLFNQDLAILRCLATYLERTTKLGKDREWVQIIDEIGKTLFEEIDFIQEGKNADRFRKNLKYEERICIPRIFWHYTTKKLITIEFVPGTKITDLDTLKSKNIDLKELALVLVNAYFKQFFEDGFYHADPHPGNIVVKDDGTIVFYDFGMVGRINEALRGELANILLSVIGNDTETLLTALKKLELIKSDADLEPIKRIIEQGAYRYYDGSRLDSLDLNSMEDDLKKIFEEKPMKLPSKFTYTLRATGTLEGICRTLDPDFSLIASSKPYFKNWMKNNAPETKWVYLKTIFPKQNQLIDRVKIYLEVLKDLPYHVDRVRQLEKSESLNTENSKTTLLENENKSLQGEVKRFYFKSQLANGVIFVFCMVYLGSFLAEKANYFINITGFFVLIASLLSSIGLVVWAVSKRKVLE